MLVTDSKAKDLYVLLSKGTCPNCKSVGKLTEVDMNSQVIKTCSACQAGFIVYSATGQATTF